MSREAARPDRPTMAEARELLTVARLAAINHGARQHEADDVASTTAEKLTRRWADDRVVSARQRGTATWHAYVSTTAKHALYDNGRSEKRDRRRQALASGQPERPASERPGSARHSESDPTDLDRYLAAQFVVEMLDESSLTAREKAVLALNVIEGLKTTQISERLGITPAIVNRHRRRGLAKLRIALNSKLG